MFSINILSRYMGAPTYVHIGIQKKVLRYLKGTKDLGIWYLKNKAFVLKGHSDRDWT